MTAILTISLHRSKTGLKRCALPAAYRYTGYWDQPGDRLSLLSHSSDSMMDVLILYSVTTGWCRRLTRSTSPFDLT